MISLDKCINQILITKNCNVGNHACVASLLIKMRKSEKKIKTWTKAYARPLGHCCKLKSVKIVQLQSFVDSPDMNVSRAGLSQSVSTASSRFLIQMEWMSLYIHVVLHRFCRMVPCNLMCFDEGSCLLGVGILQQKCRWNCTWCGASGLVWHIFFVAAMCVTPGPLSSG